MTMGKIRRAIANFITARRGQKNLDQMFGPAWVAAEWEAAAKRGECLHQWVLKRETGFQPPEVCIYCGAAKPGKGGLRNV